MVSVSKTARLLLPLQEVWKSEKKKSDVFSSISEWTCPVGSSNTGEEVGY